MTHSWGPTELSLRASGTSDHGEADTGGGSLLESEPETERDPEPDEPDDDQGEPEPDPLPKDIQFDILKNKRRRLVLRYLFDNETPASIGTLSEHVAGIENDKEPHTLDSQERKRAYVGLYQCHLPRMDDADVIDFNKSRGQVELGTHAEALRSHIEPDGDDSTGWARRYLVASLLGLGAYLVLQSSVIAVEWLGVAALIGTLLAVAGTAGLQLVTDADEE